MVILKGKEHQAAWYQEPALLQDRNRYWRIAKSDNGWTTDEIGLHWLKEVFEPYSKHHSTGAKRLLILDGHSSHLSAEFDTFCKKNAIICLCMPPHTSHLLQPLDVGVFGPLKRAVTDLAVSASRDDTELRWNHWIIVDGGYAGRNKDQFDIWQVYHVITSVSGIRQELIMAMKTTYQRHARSVSRIRPEHIMDTTRKDI